MEVSYKAKHKLSVHPWHPCLGKRGFCPQRQTQKPCGRSPPTRSQDVETRDSEVNEWLTGLGQGYWGMGMTTCRVSVWGNCFGVRQQHIRNVLNAPLSTLNWLILGCINFTLIQIKPIWDSWVSVCRGTCMCCKAQSVDFYLFCACPGEFTLC